MQVITRANDIRTSTRKVRLIDAVPYLRDWLNYHPFKQDKDAYLFINLHAYGRKLKDNGIMMHGFREGVKMMREQMEEHKQ